MSEKRFTKSIQCFMPCYFDNGKHMTANNVEELLNTLYEENEWLKQVLKNKDELLKKTLQVNNNLQKELEKCQTH